ncbi:MAG: glycosyltransferase [Ignavibacterium sp.]|nr:glycosyltransferase [Ignavibacterium sp.]
MFGNIMNLSPVALFVYARPEETSQTIESLKKNFLASDTKLFIFSDGARNDEDMPFVEEVRKLIRNINGGFSDVQIIERKKNLGLANSIITGVTQILEQFEKIIVIEEDLISSPNFLNYMNESLNFYRDSNEVFSVTGYTYQLAVPVDYKFDNYFVPRCESLGWGTWNNRWSKVDWEMKNFKNFIKNKRLRQQFNSVGADLLAMLLKQQIGILDSWAVRWCYAHFQNNAFCSYPIKSKIIHIGVGGFATHVKNENKILNTELDDELKVNFLFSDEIFLDDRIIKQYKKMFRKRIMNRLRTLYYLFKYLTKR